MPLPLYASGTTLVGQLFVIRSNRGPIRSAHPESARCNVVMAADAVVSLVDRGFNVRTHARSRRGTWTVLGAHSEAGMYRVLHASDSGSTSVVWLSMSDLEESECFRKVAV